MARISRDTSIEYTYRYMSDIHVLSFKNIIVQDRYEILKFVALFLASRFTVLSGHCFIASSDPRLRSCGPGPESGLRRSLVPARPFAGASVDAARDAHLAGELRLVQARQHLDR